MMKKCIKCSLEKSIDFFYKTPQNKDGYFNRCKQCCKKENEERKGNIGYYEKQKDRLKKYRKKTGNNGNKKYYKTLKGFVVRIYCGMKRRISSKNEKLYYGLDILDKKSFYNFSYNDNNLRKLYIEYEKSGWDKKFAPSIDRINPKLGYTISNIRWITYSENSYLSSVTTPRGFDISGKKVYKLLVIEPSVKKNGKSYWKCLCDCGNYTEKSSDQLLQGRVKSCGCYKKQKRQKIDPPNFCGLKKISFSERFGNFKQINIDEIPSNMEDNK